MSAAGPEHEAYREQAALYVLDALSPAEAAAFEAHLGTCAECAEDIRTLRPAVAALAGAVPQVDPPPALRYRVLSSVAGRAAAVPFPVRPRTSPALPWLAAAASLAAAIGLGVYALQLRTQLDVLSA